MKKNTRVTNKGKKIRKGDEVIVISGKNRGKKGAVLGVISGGSKLLIDGVNSVKKHVKANPQTGEKGGIVIKFMPLDRSNVMLYDPAQGKGSRIGIRVLKDGMRARYYKSTSELVDN
jgi:large subunit ribosomal protein L24